MSIDTVTSDIPTREARPRAEVGSALLITLALLSALAPFATDLYLPAFPEMVGDLSTSTTGVQLSLTAFLIGAGLGQLVFGPLSDRLGRRGPLIVGTVLFVVASAGAAMAPTIELLVVARLFQGLFGAAGMVIGRAIISDRAHGKEAARAFSIMMLVGGIAPIVAPFLGSMLAEPLGWRGLLAIVAVIGAIAAVAVLVVVRESRTREAIEAETRAGGRGVLRELASRAYVTNTLAYAFAFATMMAYISASPFLYQDMMGLTPVQYGLAFALNAIALAVVSSVSAKLTYRFAVRRLAGVGLAVNLLAIVALVALVLSDVPPIWLGVPILVAVGSLGLVFGNTTALALEAVPEASGSASAVLGLLQFTLAGVVSPLVGIAGESTALPLAVVMLVASAVAALSFAIGARRAAASTTPSAAPDGAADSSARAHAGSARS